MAQTFTSSFGGPAPPPIAAPPPDVEAVAVRLSDARSLPELMELLTQAVRGLLHADGATFVIREGDRCRYAEEDAIAPLWKGRRFPLDACISGWCMIHGQPVSIPDIREDARVPQDAYRPTFVRSLAMAPVGGDVRIAALGAYWAEVRGATPHELQLLQSIAAAAAPVLDSLQHAAAAPIEPQPVEATVIVESSDAAEASRVGLLTRLRRDGLRQNSPAAYVFAGACVLAATLARTALDALGADGLVPFATYFPAVLLVTLIGGAGPGLLTAGLGCLLGCLIFMPPGLGRGPLSGTDTVNVALFIVSAGLLVGMVRLHQLRLDRVKMEDARHLTLAREQEHRVQNAIHLVETIVQRTLASDPVQARILNQRIRAGLASVEIRYASSRRPISAPALLGRELKPFDLDRFSFHGETGAVLAPEVAGILTLAVHELATNALKYGALSVDEGRVSVSWRLDGRRVKLMWREAGGPPVRPPERRGYGTALLHRLVEASRGAMTTDYRSDGVVAQIVLPLDPRSPG